jgi:hypothetical protein
VNNERKTEQKRRYFDRPDPGVKPLTFWETFVIVLSAHLGVRSSAQRREDFQRANGFHLFIIGIIYFASILATLAALVTYIAK